MGGTIGYPFDSYCEILEQSGLAQKSSLSRAHRALTRMGISLWYASLECFRLGAKLKLLSWAGVVQR